MKRKMNINNMNIFIMQTLNGSKAQDSGVMSKKKL